MAVVEAAAAAAAVAVVVDLLVHKYEQTWTRQTGLAIFPLNLRRKMAQCEVIQALIIWGTLLADRGYKVDWNL